MLLDWRLRQFFCTMADSEPNFGARGCEDHGRNGFLSRLVAENKEITPTELKSVGVDFI